MQDDASKSRNTEAKRAAAAKAVELVTNDMTVGLGSGSTSSLAIGLLGARVKDGLRIRAVASSVASEKLALQNGIRVADPSEAEIIDIAIDGADEVDKKGNLIKGGGGSLLREKIIAYSSKRFHVMIDDSKLVDHLGGFALPLEIAPFAYTHTLRQIGALGCHCSWRKTPKGMFISDNGNYIADCKFERIADPAWLDVKLKMIPGVVETGIFLSQVVTSVIIGYKNRDAVEVPVTPQ